MNLFRIHPLVTNTPKTFLRSRCGVSFGLSQSRKLHIQSSLLNSETSTQQRTQYSGISASSLVIKKPVLLAVRPFSLFSHKQPTIDNKRPLSPTSLLWGNRIALNTAVKQNNFNKSQPGKLSSKRSFSTNSSIISNNLTAAVTFAAVFSIIVYFASPYLFNRTPLRYFKRHPDHLVYLIAAINVAIWGLWRVPALSSTMQLYFLLKTPLSSGFNVFQMVGSVFSHQEPWHLAMNMLGFVSFGTTLATFLGPANFLTMYLVSGTVGSLFSVGLPILLKTGLHFASLGASGAVFGVLGCFSWFFPTAGVSLFFIPVPGGCWFAFLASLVGNTAGLFFKWGNFDYAAHLGGSLIGLASGWYYSRFLKRQTRRFF